MTRWDRYFLSLAELGAGMSKDPSTQVGAVIVGPDHEVRSTGFNGLPRGLVDQPGLLSDREMKLKLIVHAEENAILNVARTGGASLRGCELYSTLQPCCRCAVSIMQVGIKRVAFPHTETWPERWREDFALALEVLSDAGIEVVSLLE